MLPPPPALKLEKIREKKGHFRDAEIYADVNRRSSSE